ncbi:hypothetical protein [Telmatospirillum sp.]|uniref:hypothetical protein n=1 Tax=Telmatospirillum sp. TaxID=2079197 RepID=UPI002844216F|nr:hypothetical protein [Telmatospirillum sp.]MDR3440323.1 hypothetical protein [Telmatospirillum sp.]
MNFGYLVASMAVAVVIAPPGSASASSLIYQSIPDMTAAPGNVLCSDCFGLVHQAVGQIFSLSSQATATSMSFTVFNDSYFWPTSVTVGIYNDKNGVVGTSVYSKTFSSFVSDVNTGNNTDILTIDLGTGVELAADTNYLLLLTNTYSLGIPTYYILGNPVYLGKSGNQVSIEDVISPLTGDPYTIYSSEIALSISSSAVPLPDTLPLLVSSILGAAGFHMRKLRRTTAA